MYKQVGQALVICFFLNKKKIVIIHFLPPHPSPAPLSPPLNYLFMFSYYICIITNNPLPPRGYVPFYIFPTPSPPWRRFYHFPPNPTLASRFRLA